MFTDRAIATMPEMKTTKVRNVAAVACAWFAAIAGMVVSLGYLYVYGNKANLTPPPPSEVRGFLILIQAGFLVVGGLLAAGLWKGKASVMGRWGMLPYLPLVFLYGSSESAVWDWDMVPGLILTGIAYATYHGFIRLFRRGIPEGADPGTGSGQATS